MGHQHPQPDSTIQLHDIHGQTVLVPRREVMLAIQEQGIMVFGLDMATIAALRELYVAAGGPMPITAQQVHRFTLRDTAKGSGS